MKRAARSPRARVKPRLRRDPEEARGLILQAAERLVGERGPDAVGLKDVAKEAGVSHALVSHYFGTYAALVDAVLELRGENLRARVLALLGDPSAEVRPALLLDRLWDVLASPSAVRLTAWALLSGRADGADFFPRRVQGMRLVADAVEARSRTTAAAGGAPSPPREDIEFLVALSFVVTLGYGLGRTALRASLGKRANADGDADFRARVVELFELYLARRTSPADVRP